MTAILESFRVAIEALWANKLRALLTMLGVIIGVTSFIAMIALVQGIRQKFIEQIQGNGTNLIFAFYQPQPDRPSHGFEGLTLADAEAAQSQCALIDTQVSPIVSSGVTAKNGVQTYNAQLYGVLAAYARTNSIELDEGRFITTDDDANWGRACVIGAKVKSKLFGKADAIGGTIECTTGANTDLLTIVGVLKQKDPDPFGENYDKGIFASLHAVQKRFTGRDTIDDFSAKSTDILQTEAAADEIWGMLKRRHPANYKDFIVDTQEGLLKQADKFLSGIQVVLGGIGGLALLTGGIGIMNIMLVSVTERTREIGIRKAVGATWWSIMLQFMVEAMVVSGFGGLIGIGLAFLIELLVNSVQKSVYMFIPVWAVALGVLFAVGVGLFFGVYPAYRAARLDPIEALRHE
jgi:putative ABC transport system permease protein